MKEVELATLLFVHPELAASEGEALASLSFSDRSLDRFRHELLNLAASDFRLERRGLEGHLGRSGQQDLVDKLTNRAAALAEVEDASAQFRATVAQLRDLAEGGTERARAMERFKSEGTEESWREAARLLGQRSD
jgi:hypothetical protein